MLVSKAKQQAIPAYIQSLSWWRLEKKEENRDGQHQKQQKQREASQTHTYNVVLVVVVEKISRVE